MAKYQLQIPLKTKLLNIFRRIFLLPFAEKWLVKKLSAGKKSIYLKLIPPDYLYKNGTMRNTVRHNLNYQLDISHVVDHSIYYSIKDASFDNFLDSYVKKGDIIFDIGANIGTTLTRLAIKTGDRGYVIGFE